MVFFFILFRSTQAIYFLKWYEVLVVIASLFSITYLALKLSLIIFVGRKSICTIWVTFLFLPSLFFTSVVELLKKLRLVDSVQWNREVILMLAAFWLVLFVFLKLSKSGFLRMINYLNVLFAVLIVYQAGLLLLKISNANEVMERVRSGRAMQSEFEAGKNLTDSLPDIYFLIFDGYTGNAGLRHFWNYNNGDFTNELIKKGFQVSDSAVSGYANTQICLSSLLNMDYQVNWYSEWKEDYQALTEYLLSIRDNRLIKFLYKKGYKVYNYSFFELGHQPAYSTFKALSGTRNFYRFVLENSILLRFYNNPFNAEQGKNNLKVLEAVERTAVFEKGPKFVYGHFMLPHPAYYFDSSGHYYPDGKGKFPAERENYLEQLKFTNSVIQKLADTILHQEPFSILVVQGDHGSRLMQTADTAVREAEYHQPFSAIYFPGQSTDSIAEPLFTPNTFRYVLNKYFDTRLPLLTTRPEYYYHLKPGR